MKKKTGEYSISKRTTRAFIITAILLIPISVFMALAGMQLTRNRENAQSELKMNVLSRFVANESDMFEAAKAQFDRNLSANLEMVTTSLKAFVTDDGYTGPRVLSDGFVVERRGDSVVLPQGVPKGRMSITANMIERSLESGAMRTGRLFADAGEGQPSENSYLSFARITDDLIYVEVTSHSVFQEVVEACFVKSDAAEESESDGFGGITLVVSETDDGVEVLRSYGDAGVVDNRWGVGITPEQIRQRTPFMILNGTTYRCSYSTMMGEWDGRENPLMVQMLPIVTIGTRSIVQAAIICYAMMLILVNLIVYVMSVQRYVREHVITPEQAARYNPGKLRVRMINAGVIGTLAVFVVSMIVAGVGQLFLELKDGRETLRVFSKQLEQVDQYQTEALERNQENWYVHYGEDMASLLSSYPTLATPETLQRYCDILGVDFIMLFDNQGYETLCNRDYVGFTLDKGLGENSSDFRRLLYGMPSIVHAASTDSITGLERQMIGVKLPASDNGTKHGALVMALLPEQTKRTTDLYQLDEKSALFAMSGTRCIAVDAETGVIQHDSEDEMVGRSIVECGLNEKSLQDGYMDFDVVDGRRHFVVTTKHDDSVYYYMLEADRMFGKAIKYGLVSTLLFALATAIILLYVLVGYKDALYAEWAVVCMPAEVREWTRKRKRPSRKEAADADTPDVAERRIPGKIRGLIDKLADVIHWNSRLPEEKSNLVFKVSMLILLLSWTGLLLSKNIVYNKFDSLAGFLLQGDWMRGANLFAFCSILLIIAYAYLINVVSQAVLLMASGFLLGKGQTFCRLLRSFIKYFSLFVVLYLILHYLGFPIGTVVGSLSITTLAISLGAKDLAADILVGLSIVFERTFQVGDIVEINGKRGKVQEIGVRSTKLIDPVNNVLIISNHEIRDILNLTQDLSEHSLDIKVRLSGSLTELEEILNRELPLIGEKNDKIVSLYYLGVTSLSNNFGSASVITVGIGACCQEDDADEVMLFLNRELRLLSEREDFAIV